MNFIFGAAGFAKEVDWLIEDLFSAKRIDYRTNCFVAEDGNKLIGTTINSAEVIAESDFFNKYASNENNCFVAVGNPLLKEKIVQKIKSVQSKSRFPNLVHPTVSFDHRPGKLILGEGNILCSQSVLTTDIKLHNFIHINLDCTVGHDSMIEDYTTISPGVHISGNVAISEKVFFGTGAVVLEHVKICAGAKIGAGATVITDINESGTYVGTPARKVK